MNPAHDAGADGPQEDATGETARQHAQRLDKWLWFARIVKSRTLAAALIEAGKIRVNKVKAVKASQTVKPGDVVTSTVKKTVRVLSVRAIGTRRGPAAEAAALYADLTPPAKPAQSPSTETGSAAHPRREPGTGRPTKRDRRDIDRLHGRR
jgi:ribosome-associated heat shock protein Hsp15